MFFTIILFSFSIAHQAFTASDTTPPSVPTNLRTNNLNCTTKITLLWVASTDNVAVTGYNIYRSGIKIATSTTTQYQDTDLSPSTTYNYTVAAYDAAGNVSEQSNSVSATTKATPLPGNTTPKKGVGLGWGVGTEEQIKAIGASWAYDWGPGNWNLTRLKETSYEWVPMFHNTSSTSEAKIASIAVFRKENDLGHYWLIFNEPDFIHQDNITPEEGAKRYKELREQIKKYDLEAKLIVGGVFYTGTVSGGADMGWLRSFRGEYYNLYKEWPVVEGWHVHLYKGWSDYNKQIWQNTLKAVRDWMTYNGGIKELWLTEFGSLNSEATARQIMEDQVPWLEQQSWLTRYAWFATYANGPGCSGCTGSLLNPDFACGGLNDLGKLYVTFGNPPAADTIPPAAPSGVMVN